MFATTRIEVPERLRALVTLARLLELIERSAEPVGAEQYRSIVQHLKTELATVDPDETFRQLLTLFPAMSELYENLHYEHAGLCCSPLDAALAAEIQARSVISRAAEPPR